MRKPDLCFFQHVIDNIRLDPSQIVMVDDQVSNICAARSLGMHGLLADKALTETSQTLRNMFLSPIARAEEFMRTNARNHHSVAEGQDVILKDNFSQLLIWGLTGDANLIYLRWPSGKLHGPQHSVNGKSTSEAISFTTKVENGLWNYFYDEPIPKTQEPPANADTTSIAYLSIPESYLSEVADVNLIMEKMSANVSPDGIMQTYFDEEMPRTSPEVCCNILRLFHRFGRGADPQVRKTEEWVVQCLKNRAYVYGSQRYSVPEAFLYFIACLYSESKREPDAVKEALLERVNVTTNPLALALRVSACQTIDIDPHLYRQDLMKLMSLQEEDGGWPPGHFYRSGSSGACIGNRGLATALAIKIHRHENARTD